MKQVMFLDDEDRHYAFKAKIKACGIIKDIKFHYVYTCLEAIECLDRNYITQAFLDHDLGTVGTGMDVVDHILKMSNPPNEIVVHSLNFDAAVKMCTKLASTKKILVKRLPFPVLIQSRFQSSP
jgi:hypothetical protein